jgi:hypothetical protein
MNRNKTTIALNANPVHHIAPRWLIRNLRVEREC